MEKCFYFAQLTDVHIGTNPNPAGAELNLQWALSELDCYKEQISALLFTGDCVCNGSRNELLRFKELADTSKIPWYALPANHDLWGEPDDSAWQEIIGAMRHSVDVEDFKFILYNDIRRNKEGKWSNIFSDSDYAWLENELASAGTRRTVVCIHNPPSSDSHHYSRWSKEDGARLLSLLAKYHTVALISGDYHANDEWESSGVKIINSGALAGFFWTGQGNFPIKPGYRIFAYEDGVLRNFWREGSYWPLPPTPEENQLYCGELPLYATMQRAGQWWSVPHYERIQISLTNFGGVGTGGPRPVVRPMYIFDKTTISAQVFSQHLEIASVNWSVFNNEWHPMERVWNGIWSEYQADFDPSSWRNGEYLCKVQAIGADGSKYYDTIPVIICGPRNAPRVDAPVFAAPTQVFHTMRTPYD